MNNYRIMDYDTRLLPNKWLADKERPQTLNQATSQSGLSCGHPGWGLVYHLVLCSISPHKHSVIVETGTNWGAMTIVVAQAILDSKRDVEIHTVEIDAHNHLIAKKNFEEAGVDSIIDPICDDSLNYLKTFNKPIDMAFLDGSHEEKDVLQEFHLVQPLLVKGGIIVFDNTNMGGVANALKFIKPTIHLPFVSWDPPGIDIYQKE